MATLVERVISTFDLTEVQRQAASERGKDVIVTAGAGSGKTRTLVARYVSLLAEGFEPRRVVAVTFTEKLHKSSYTFYCLTRYMCIGFSCFWVSYSWME